MLSEDFARVEALFAELVVLDSTARARALETSFADRPDLRDEVVALLDAHDRIGDGGDAADAGVERHAIRIGTQLGPFRLVEAIGEGGMGEVYRAARTDGGFTQQVAIKIMRSTLVDVELLRRFKVERQVLASLQHPNIVTLLDGGATAEGLAYFVMEFVDGTEITRHCREHRLSLNGRLELFRTLCAAVQYAHQHGIVHRDLKPANILIGSDGVLKVLDFGVAKLLHTQSGDGAMTKGVLPGPLTPNYASPEQLLGLPVTTASDGYALGIMLYQLVTDVRPYETTGLTLDRLLDLVVHSEPARPSAVPSHRHLRGDIDAIVLKAISKDAANRYNSAAEFGNDVARFLAGEPVLARAPSTGYVLRRLVARNKTLVAVSALALVAILTASGAALWQREVARGEQARAEQRFREVRQLANALIFKVHDAVAPLAGSTPVRRTIVDEALAYLERLERESGADDVTLRLELAAAYRQIGGILGGAQTANLGDREGAIRQYERARAILLPLATETADYDVISALSRVDSSLSTLYSLKNNREHSLAMAREGVERATRYRERNAGDSRGLEMLAAATFQLAWTMPGEERVPMWRRTLEHYERLLAEGPEQPQRQRNVALVEKYLGALLPYDQAASHFKRAAELDEKRLATAPDDRQAQFDTAISLASLAEVNETQGDLDGAARLLERSLAIRQRLAATDPGNVQVSERLGYVLARLAGLQLKRGALSAARPRAHEAVRVLQAVFDVTKDRTAQETLAYAWLEVGQVERAAGDRGASCRAFQRAHQLYAPAASAVSRPEIRDEVLREAVTCR